MTGLQPNVELSDGLQAWCRYSEFLAYLFAK